MTNKDLRRNARERLKGSWGLPILICFLMGIFQGIATIPEMIESIVLGEQFITSILVSLFVTMPLAYGAIIFFLGFVRREDVSVETIFAGYKQLGRAIASQLLVGIYTFLWTLLLIIPGIIKAYSYSMTLYILADNPEMGANEAITQSRKMMKGYKWRFFLLNLSFLGWGILSLLTIGIGFLCLIPYMQTSISNFYEEVKSQYIPNDFIR